MVKNRETLCLPKPIPKVNPFLKKSQSIKSISGITMPVKDGMYFHPFLDK
jgi:hypothetical protein